MTTAMAKESGHTALPGIAARVDDCPWRRRDFDFARLLRLRIRGASAEPRVRPDDRLRLLQQ